MGERAENRALGKCLVENEGQECSMMQQGLNEGRFPIRQTGSDGEESPHDTVCESVCMR